MGAPGAGGRPRPRRHLRGGRHGNGLRQVPGVPRAGPQRSPGGLRGTERPGRHRALPRAHEGPGGRPAAGRGGDRRPAGQGGARGRLRRRHAVRGARVGPPVRDLRTHQPRHAPSGCPAEPFPVVLLPPAAPLRRDRRVPHLPGRLRLARRPGHTQTAACLRPLRRRSRLPPRLRDRRRPRRHRDPADGRARRRGHRGRLTARRGRLRPVGAPAHRAQRGARRPGAPHGDRRGRRPADGPGARRHPHGGLRALPAGGRADLRHRPGTPRRDRPCG